MNHTKGPITVGEYDENAGYDSVTGGIKVGPLTLDAADYGQETAWSDNPWDRERMEADAALIAEAFNVATESGLTPKQLAARVARLETALKWYETEVGLCNRHGDPGNEARDRLARDIGLRAKEALYGPV